MQKYIIQILVILFITSQVLADDYNDCCNDCILKAANEMQNLSVSQLLKETQNMQKFTGCMTGAGGDQSAECKIMYDMENGDVLTRIIVENCIDGCADGIPDSSVIGKEAKCITKCADKYLPADLLQNSAAKFLQ
ncbi:Tim10/DDP family zinc finger [Pseudocohnilembus persalinus]|uniref:Mitochondrial import inner membrane translocase subunit n=1 Tax=Pseudocohnilembus persalinus TaxID=266149 RepID=A0A0V0QSW1_PSEPJ|nr:Tim10/DDP family zinc finger [Pseudocohnilembus persalinus]|eukprot:KRX05261.1 Tim10/DDP family zinc finger [Pseudocohnilembus persalinus]